MKFAFKGIGIGVFVAAGPDTGSIEYRVDHGSLAEAIVVYSMELWSAFALGENACVRVVGW